MKPSMFSDLLAKEMTMNEKWLRECIAELRKKSH